MIEYEKRFNELYLKLIFTVIVTFFIGFPYRWTCQSYGGYEANIGVLSFNDFLLFLQRQTSMEANKSFMWYLIIFIVMSGVIACINWSNLNYGEKDK